MEHTEDQALKAELQRLREALRARQAQDIVASELAKIKLPDATRARLAEALGTRVPLTEQGDIDEPAYRKLIGETAQAELAYLAQITEAGRVVGIGITQSSPDEARRRLIEALQRMGLQEAAAKAAAN